MPSCCPTMARRSLRPTLVGFTALLIAMWTTPLPAAPLDFQVFTDRQHYTAVLLQQGRVQTDADWNEESAGPIKLGQRFAIFSFDFNPNAVRLAVAPGIVGGLAVGAEPNGTLGGDQGFTLHVNPGLALTAFGAEITFAPSSGPVPPEVFRLLFGCPDVPCFIVESPAGLGPGGGTLFLGGVAGPDFPIGQITVEAVSPRDPSGEPVGAVPAWQLGAISFFAVPAPSSAWLMAWGLLGTLAARRRSAR